jgi:hypothetical protein
MLLWLLLSCIKRLLPKKLLFGLRCYCCTPACVLSVNHSLKNDFISSKSTDLTSTGYPFSSLGLDLFFGSKYPEKSLKSIVKTTFHLSRTASTVYFSSKFNCFCVSFVTVSNPICNSGHQVETFYSVCFNSSFASFNRSILS